MASETMPIGSQSVPSSTPTPLKNSPRNRPTSALDAHVNARYVPRRAQPEKKPARGPSVTPEKAYTEPAWLK
jgi:hypothetical protein